MGNHLIEDRTSLSMNALHPEVLPGQCIHELFEAQAAKQLDKTAVCAGEKHLSYRQLNEQANRLARHLQDLGVTADTLVGVHLERSLELIVALVGILKAGGAYVPLDPSYPAERLSFMLKDTRVPILLTTRTLAR